MPPVIISPRLVSDKTSQGQKRRTKSPRDTLHGDDAVTLVKVRLPRWSERRDGTTACEVLKRRDVENDTGTCAPEYCEDERADGGNYN